MSNVSYKIFFGDHAATRSELEHIEEITVEQDMDKAWEARIRMFLCLDEKGHWKHDSNSFAEPFSRVRVEIKLGKAESVPLIDGPVVDYHTTMDSQPGRSHVDLVVRDDSVLLNREEKAHVFHDKTDKEVAGVVFHDFRDIIPTTRIGTPEPDQQRVAVRRGTAIQFLRNLAHAHGFHAYVLPGRERGKSIGCFLPDPDTPDGLPPMVLMGAGRNLADIRVSEEAESPQRTTGSTMRLDDQNISSFEAETRALDLMRPLPPIPHDDTALRLLPPEANDREDPQIRSQAATRRASYAYKLSARTVPGCYSDVLTPYRKVSVHAGNTLHSGDYLLTKVTHRITPSLYTQEFEAKSDSRSDPHSTQENARGGTGVSVNFSTSLSIF